MRLPARMAGLCASAVFIITIIPVIYHQLNPASPIDDSFSGLELLESLGFSIVGSIIAGIIGLQIGGIMARPKGKKKQKRPPSTTQPTAPEPEKAAPSPESRAAGSEERSTGAPSDAHSPDGTPHG